MSSTCIRVLADVNQIKQCRENIGNVDESLLVLSSTFNLVGNDVRIKILYLLRREKAVVLATLSDILGMSVLGFRGVSGN